jgi:hypothetical protein
LPDNRHHRGAHPEDAHLFAPDQIAALRAAVGDLSWLLTLGYASTSAVKVVGDRYSLNARQRIAVMRCSCGDTACKARSVRRVSADALAGRVALIDGYNLLITIEAALGGGVVLVGRDGCYRDMASMHGTYRSVDETIPALLLIGNRLAALNVGGARWYLDSPVSNSGRLKGVMAELAEKQGWAGTSSWFTTLMRCCSRASRKTASSSPPTVRFWTANWRGIRSQMTSCGQTCPTPGS